MAEENKFEAIFAPETTEEWNGAGENDLYWKILLVDDAPDIHAALHMALADVEVDGIPLQIYDAESAAQARELLVEHPDIALILLDVVMESEQAGLDLVRVVREDLENRQIQIVVLTGQPGYAPQRSVIAGYAIDGYRLKSELTADKIFVTVYAAVRAYRTRRDLEQQRIELQNLARTLSEREERLRAVVETAPDAILLVDEDGLLFGWNEGAQRLFGYRREAIVGTSYLHLVLPEQRASAQEEFARFCSGHMELLQGRAWEVVGLAESGEKIPIELVIGAWETGGRRNFSAIIRDIRARRQAEDDLRLAASVYAHSYEGIIIANAHQIILDVNPAFTRITGFSREEVLGRDALFMVCESGQNSMLGDIESSVREMDFWQGEVCSQRKDGSIFTEVLSVSVIRDQTGRLTHTISVFSDISLLKEHERELVRVANYDTLTGLPNRRLLADRMMQAMARSRRTGRSMALCYLDLDGFKRVNDELGHVTGDSLLVEVTERLKTILREDDTLARIGGDEFVLLLVGMVPEEEAWRNVVERILQKISMPMALEGKSVSISASIGVTLFPEDDCNTDTLLRHCDQAMYLAKDKGKNCYQLFDAEYDREIKDYRLRVEEITRAITRREFVLYYQPKVDLSNGQVVGAEALIRWRHPELGLLPPGEFLRFAEGNDQEVLVGEWVLREVLEQMTDWKSQGLALTISANIGATHLLRENFAGRLRHFLELHPMVRPGELELEILETTGLGDMKAAVRTLNNCRRLGVQISLDDFGTGYSSLTYFLKLPVHLLKVDQSFVRGMLEDPNDLGMVEGMIRLARAFNRMVIAEGVETLEHGALLLSLGCHLMQGYGIARPMPASELPQWVNNWRRGQLWRSLPPVSHDENRVLAIASQSFNRWVEDVLHAQQHPEEAPDSLPDSSSCAFGRWYGSSGYAHYGSQPVYQKIAPLHERCHEIAFQLLNPARGVPDAMALTAKLRQVQEEINHCLQTLVGR